MADLQCMICDYTVEDLTPEDELLTLLGATPGEAGPILLAHMETHTLIDWVKAFKMADAYIEKLEGQIADLESRPVPTAYVPPTPTEAGRFQPVPPEDAERWLSPGDLSMKRQQMEARRRIQEADPDQTLIPRIPDAMRPEGVVGLKY